MIFPLVQDFADALASMPREHARYRILKLLDKPIRRDVHFIDRHPMTFFQCMWNICWWYDCPEAAGHYLNGQVPGGISTRPLSGLLNQWRNEKQRFGPGFRWLRMLRPPPMHLATGQHTVLRGHVAGVTSVALSPDDRCIVSASKDKTLRYWDAVTGNALRTLEGLTSRMISLAFSPDGRRIVAGAEDTTVRIWDVQTGQELRQLNGHEDRVASVACSPDNKRIASGSRDKTVRVWDAETGEELRCLVGHSEAVTSVMFSPDRQCIVSGSGDCTARIWDIETRKELRRLIGHGDPVTSIAVSPDGRTGA